MAEVQSHPVRSTSGSSRRPRSPQRSPLHSPSHSLHLPRSPSPPRQTFHPPSIIPSVPTPALLESVAGGAHYSGIKVDGEGTKKRRRSSVHREASGLVSSGHQRVLDDLKELYCCRPSVEIFERTWRKDGQFQDPLCIARGYGEYAAQFFAMAKIISESKTLASRVMSTTQVPNRIVYHQKQEYTLPFFGKKKVIESIIVVELDEDDKIISVLDQWGGKELPTSTLAAAFRIANAKVTPWLVRVPKPAS